MSPRIWPGALCYITASEYPENVGRVVIAESLESDSPRMWNIVAQGVPLLVWSTNGLDRFPSFDAAAPEASLRPLTPPPASDTTEDRAPCEVESA